MTTRTRRKNESALRWVRASLFAGLTWWALSWLGLTPALASPVLAGIAGVTALFSPGVAVLIALAALSLPVLAADLVTGVVFLVIGFASVQYLAQGRARVFLLVLAAVLLTWAGPLWAAAALAGVLLGASEGAIAALLACLAVQAAGILAGEPAAGAAFTGAGGPAAVSLANLPDNLLAFGWISDAATNVSPAPLIAAFSGIANVPVLLLQPLAWAAGAATAGLVRGAGVGSEPSPIPRAPVAAAAGVGAAALLHTGVLALFDLTPGMTDIVVAAVGSLLVALLVAALLEWVFPPLPCAAPPSPSRSLSAEDADVDELLSLIAQAEDELASKHTVNTTVMLTDMKSFSAMTEEDGSVTSAKAIQRHRDLLIPIIEDAGGSGKSTGGDGLLAAFPDAAAAVRAAVTMQRALREYNQAHSAERAISIRIGIASGEVVLDRHGRPFIGTALNLAARIMNLGDGGQVLVSKPVATAARQAGLPTHHHGGFDLKNISGSVPVDEVLWAEDQEPTAPRCE